MELSPYVRFEVTGDLAVAGYFIMANWPDPETVPTLDTSGGPLCLIIDTRTKALTDLRTMLSRVCDHGGILADSARAWLRVLDARGIPDVERPPTSREGNVTASSPRAR
jgi:hypothetical protein